MIGDGAPLHYFVLFQQHVFEPIGVYHQHGEPWCFSAQLLVSRNGPWKSEWSVVPRRFI